MTSAQRLAAQVKAQIARRSWRPAEFARQMGHSSAWASQILRGKGTTLKTLDEIAAFFQTTSVSLLDADQERVNPRIWENSDAASLPVTPVVAQSAHLNKGGVDVLPETQARLVAAEARIASLESEYAAMRDLVAETLRKLSKLTQSLYRKDDRARKGAPGHRARDGKRRG